MVRTAVPRISRLWHTPIVQHSPRTSLVHLHRPPSGTHVALFLTSPGRAPLALRPSYISHHLHILLQLVPLYLGRQIQSLPALHSYCAFFLAGSVIQVRSVLAALFLAMAVTMYRCWLLPYLSLLR